MNKLYTDEVWKRGGLKIKILEAFWQGRPVGLRVKHGMHHGKNRGKQINVN